MTDLPPKRYSMGSMRKGGNTANSSSGATLEEQKKGGNWKSDCGDTHYNDHLSRTDGGRGVSKGPSARYALNTFGLNELRNTYKTSLEGPSRTRSKTVEEEEDCEKELTPKGATHDHNTRAGAKAKVGAGERAAH
jgi:hypothetical protein